MLYIQTVLFYIAPTGAESVVPAYYPVAARQPVQAGKDVTITFATTGGFFTKRSLEDWTTLRYALHSAWACDNIRPK